MLRHKKSRLRGFSLRAFQTRMNAVWFNGAMNDTQADCLAGFTAAYLIYNNVLGRHVPVSWLAYVLATTYHETAFTMKPVEEYGKGAGRPYGEPDPETGQVYDGRGYVQLTWKENYQKAQGEVVDFRTMKCDVPLLMHPDLAMTPWVAAQVAINGMAEGWFTGKSLDDYLTDTITDYLNARRIINGTDKAQTIAAYAVEVEEALHLAHGDGIVRSVVKDGSRGDDVCELQLMLGLSPDGVSGPDTVNAVMVFQAANLLKVDGICGADTWSALGREVYGL
ncbi:peptidoglycan-binding protein [Scandinavium goeteborgense]|uniref:peptidoglycan-binding protein n=1 Tax=Scandinavium goeteborgense TaxID=1851514 RepID=UPI0021662474|nr:peptidoglycan-binding protein [Scandinavium goeteborgense]MCS2154702.1 peptidoglycan-binding protein [Scandinavium goeteborgense]